MDIQKFDNPHLLYLLFLLIPMIGYYIYKCMKGTATIQVSSVAGFGSNTRNIKYYLRHIPFVLRTLAFTLLVIAISRPQTASDTQTVTSEGVDIVMAIDVSTSMLARDFNPDRISAAKDVASKFIATRKNDRIGLVVFAGESYTQCPLTTDQATLINLTNQIKSGIISDGTAIGNGIATAVGRLRDSDAKSKVVILLTDGVNNSGQITPKTAADIAQTMGVRVYTIGVGTMGNAPYPVIDAWGNQSFAMSKVEIDETTLQSIAESTGGKYYRATDNDELKKIYDEINSLEKSKIDVESNTVYNESFSIFVLMAIGAVILEILSRYLYFRQIP